MAFFVIVIARDFRDILSVKAILSFFLGFLGLVCSLAISLGDVGLGGTILEI